MVANHFLSDKGFVLTPLGTDFRTVSFFSSAVNLKRDFNLNENPSNTCNTLDLFRVWELDEEVLRFASDEHPMNYNAWQYRRARLTLLRCCGPPCFFSNNPENSIYWDFIQRSVVEVMSYLEIHNADSSACAFLLFLFHQCAPNEGADLHEGEDSSDVPDNHRRSRVERPFSVFLWNSLMTFTQRELHRHVDKGHEGMWSLRLGLIHYALTFNSKNLLLGSPFLSSWTVADELEWISVYVEGFYDKTAMGVDNGALDEGLLAPCGDLARAWVESSGSAAWSSFLATRYGLQLIRLLTPSNARELRG
ncbi:unnamed protein product [Phytomonas sp. Hart1]|nr:unnamed protein product [Phytomonas sp. Hart1]|eukprot:CCW65943.1 unnamed protein product [Phytomonas sp. isolate Hart1]